jgi:error-prone DNA polymerase
MGWRNPPVSWSELEDRLSGRPPGDGGDSPAWSHKRPPYQPPPAPAPPRPAAAVPYAELHCHSNFSFLDGASHPEELVAEAARLGLEALAVTDHDGLYGAVRFAEAAAAVGVPTVFGAELTLELTRGAHRSGGPDPEGTHLVVLARDPAGYRRLCRALTTAHLAGGEKGRPTLDLETLATIGAGGGTGEGADHWLVLTGCRKGSVARALLEGGPARAGAELSRLQRAMGAGNVVVELWDHGDPLDSARNDALVAVAAAAGADVVATNNVHYHVPARRKLATALAAVAARRSLDDLDGWLPAASAAHLRSGAEQARRFARYPGVVERAADLGRASALDLSLVAPRLPPFPCPPGHHEMSWLRHLTEEGAARRYGPRSRPLHPRAYAQIDYELDMIERLGFAGYFLIVWDIVRFCAEAGIYCQGRGSAANSAVCYALGITNADAVSLGLLFERFLSPERDGPPDIDVDIESGRREEAIQYVYRRYGRQCAAQVANVITYRPRSAVRDMGKALGAAPGQLDAWSKQIEGWGPLDARDAAGAGVPPEVLALAGEVQHFPRHLGIHSGGMVICDRPVSEVCPVEWARMADRSVLQWDKDDCAAAGLVKFDLLGLGMLTVIHATVDHVAAYHGVGVDLARLPQEAGVYEMLCRADSVGVFQVESRAQMATLPRLRPRCFYDLVVEVALIRPGPIQGGSVHPYIRRRNGDEPVTYLHPLLKPSLAKTLGVPLFQEQLMQMAIDVAGFTAAEADRLRQAMGSKRSVERMNQLRDRFYAGMAERGIAGDTADRIWEKMVAFANFGFPESHSVSFAYLVYSSAWLKYHYPAAFLAGLLDGQPMGFWSPQTLVADARRHGVEVRRPDINRSRAGALLEPVGSPAVGPPAVRLGLSYVRHLGKDGAERIVARRDQGGPFTSMEDVVRRTGITAGQAEALATAGAFAGLGLTRREALWAAGPVARAGPALEGAGARDAARRREGPGARDAAGRGRAARLEGLVTGGDPPPLPPMDGLEATRFDLWATGISPDTHPVAHVRSQLEGAGVTPAADLSRLANGQTVKVAGVVTHRQRPATAGGVVFLNLEDETGLINVICVQAVWNRYRADARGAPALVVEGRLEKADGVINVVAGRVHRLVLVPSPLRSRDFR